MSEKDNAGTEQTFEGRMLEASRNEIKKEVSSDTHGFRRFKDSIFLFVDLYVWEPICTGLRFLHLVVIFVPVLVAVPAIWVGKRDKARGNERSGTLWWYWFLVKSMERAGPAFIKVSLLPVYKESTADVGVAGTMGGFEIGYLSYGNVRDDVPITFKCAGTLFTRNEANHKEGV
jgi:hypothetical protein